MNDYSKFLSELGLSSEEIAAYVYLVESKTDETAQVVAEQLITFPSAVYRLFYELERYKLVERVKRRPMTYRAVKPEVSFARAVDIKRQELRAELAKLNLASSTSHTEIVIGKEELYRRYVVEAQKTSQEICIHAIGIAYSEDIHAAQQAAKKRGVKVRHIVQQFTKDNVFVIDKWLKLGVELRFMPAKRGFHSMIFDNKTLLLSFSDPENTDNRISIVTDNKTAIKLFSSYFSATWRLSKPIEL